MDCLSFLGSWVADTQQSLTAQIVRMAEIVRSDSVTRAFLQVSQRGGRSDRLYLFDRVSRRPLRVASLSQLEIGRLYVFGEGHTLMRSAADTVVLAGTISIPLSVAPSVAPAEGERCSPPSLHTSHTPEPTVCRHSRFAQADRLPGQADADEESERRERRKKRRAAEARAKHEAALAATSAATARSAAGVVADAASCEESECEDEALPPNEATPTVVERGTVGAWAESLD
ncbi:hypothetical protein T492DRAFT_1010184 [Pavlovales sp. CCMP2436]|nr:hypothetical protein T492DRAFT_1010184 [Pavlovales sp. CCMP2436]